jgi:Phage tail assembly chaperone proteins, E, or 41 or 14
MSESESVTVPLLKPIQSGDKTITELTFREAEVGDLIDAAACTTEMERIATVMAAASDTPLAVFRKIKARDLKNIMAKVGSLVGNEI